MTIPSKTLAALLLAVFAMSSCATVRRPVVEPVEEQEEEEDGLREWWELHDLDLCRPWRSID